MADTTCGDRSRLASTHALRFRVTRGKASGKEETLTDDQRFRDLLEARIANAARKPRDPDRPVLKLSVV